MVMVVVRVINDDKPCLFMMIMRMLMPVMVARVIAIELWPWQC